MHRTQSRSSAGVSALWEDGQALAALTATLGNLSNRTRTRGALPDNRRGASACQ
jgi:hypothetical protein